MLDPQVRPSKVCAGTAGHTHVRRSLQWKYIFRGPVRPRELKSEDRIATCAVGEKGCPDSLLGFRMLRFGVVIFVSYFVPQLLVVYCRCWKSYFLLGEEA